MRLGEYLVALLERYGVTHVFGIPGVHTAELYRGLAGSVIRHITPRHEQGAGFTADGYARVTGKPGVCFVITGPGLTNIATAMAQAYQDSIPMLVISSVNGIDQLGRGNGNLHELPDQQGLAEKLAAFSHTLRDAEDLPDVLGRAFALFECGRPRPVHIEIPLDVMEREIEGVEIGLGPPPARAAPLDAAMNAALEAIESAERPIILAGGGCRRSAEDLLRLAEKLDAPVVMTVNARGLMPPKHPLAVPASPSMESVRTLIRDADVVLAIGTELGPTDYDMYARGGFEVRGKLVRIEIDPEQMNRNCKPHLPLLGDAGHAIALLLDRLGAHECGGVERARAARQAAFRELSSAMQRQVAFLNELRDVLPGAIIVGDSTQAVYAGNLYFEASGPSTWFNSAVGYGTLGYALPAAIGAKLGAPEKPVVCLAGDGGLQYTLAELGSAIDAGTPIIVLLWNNRGYGEIKSYFLERAIPPIGVDLATPDFVAIAKAYGWIGERLANRADLSLQLKEAAGRSVPSLIEVNEATIMA